jgi:hypothetical protein
MHVAKEEWEKVEGWKSAATKVEATFRLDASQRCCPYP